MHRIFFSLILALLAPAALRAADDIPVVDAETAKLIEGAIKYLAGNQEPSGAWNTGNPGREQFRAAMTSYVLIGFMAAGHLPNEGPYGDVVARGTKFLADSVLADGLLRTQNTRHYMYSHGIATIALAELYGQTQEPEIREKLQKLVRVIVSAQADSGGWRYRPRPSGADISVTVCIAVAVRAAREVGINVPQEVFDNAVRYIHSCAHPPTGGFTYTAGSGNPGFARTAAAIYSLQVLGEYDDPHIEPAAQYVLDNFAQGGWFAYGNHYAAAGTYMIGGDTWKQYYAKAKDKFFADVNKQGDKYYWDGRGRGGVGTNYVTAVYTMTLAMPYNYIPLYQR